MRAKGPVVVDVAAAAAKPSAAEVAAWARDQRVFVSSVMGGMTDERRAAVRAIEAVGAEPVWFEGFGGRDDDAEVAYLSEVASSTVYVGVLGRAYGRLMKSRRSATHEEYREAERRGLRIRAFARADEDLQGDQVSFLDEIRQFHVTGSYTDPGDLAAGVEAGLRWIAAEELAPWCKVGDAVFRARSVEDDGARITVRAAVQDGAVVAALEDLRGSKWGGALDTRVTWAGRSEAVQAASVVSTTTASRATEMTLVLERGRDRGGPGFGPMSYRVGGATYSADDLTDIALREALFSEAGPGGLLSMIGGIGDPIGRVPSGLSEETHASVLALLVKEALIETGRASRVPRVQVSPSGPAGRRVRVEWAGVDRTGAGGSLRAVDGFVPA